MKVVCGMPRFVVGFRSTASFTCLAFLRITKSPERNDIASTCCQFISCSSAQLIVSRQAKWACCVRHYVSNIIEIMIIARRASNAYHFSIQYSARTTFEFRIARLTQKIKCKSKHVFTHKSKAHQIFHCHSSYCGTIRLNVDSGTGVTSTEQHNLLKLKYVLLK